MSGRCRAKNYKNSWSVFKLRFKIAKKFQMIQQPELGKKIANYRKAKGLTQEDLVEKCNLSVRTLQRIEAGEVTPRAYTVKLIFEALELNYDNSFDSNLMDNKGLFSNWLEQFFISFLDLFNLKTNTMKKVTILSIMLSCIAFGLFTFVLDGKAQDKNNKATTITENEKFNNQPDSENTKNYSSCKSSFQNNEDFVGYGVEFKQKGVTGIFNLIKMNSKTGEFIAASMRGILLNNKAQVSIKKLHFVNKTFTYEADDIFAEETDIFAKTNKIVLKGNAKIVFPDNERIEADELIILLE
jgi:transcriptional regulator with XRE-family HTH domain